MKVAKTNAPLWMEARDNLERILAHQEFGDIINTKPLSITTTGACGTMVTSPPMCLLCGVCVCVVCDMHMRQCICVSVCVYVSVCGLYCVSVRVSVRVSVCVHASSCGCVRLSVCARQRAGMCVHVYAVRNVRAQCVRACTCAVDSAVHRRVCNWHVLCVLAWRACVCPVRVCVPACQRYACHACGRVQCVCACLERACQRYACHACVRAACVGCGGYGWVMCVGRGVGRVRVCVCVCVCRVSVSEWCVSVCLCRCVRGVCNVVCVCVVYVCVCLCQCVSVWCVSVCVCVCAVYACVVLCVCVCVVMVCVT